MTPIAKLIVQDGILGQNRTSSDRTYLRQLMEDVHCFETTQTMDMAWDLVKRLDGEDYKKMGDYIFLPAPKTWIEFETYGEKMAFHLEEVKGGFYMTAIIHHDGSSSFNPVGLINNNLKLSMIPGYGLGNAPKDFHKQIAIFCRLIYVLLSLINTPKIIGRRQRMPQNAFEKKLVKKLGVGKFPLHAWTEIKLQVSKPTEIDDGEEHEAHLTGRRALHFCRAHLRVRMGKLEYVSSHWRGDPAIGIKQSRYAVTP